MKALLLIVALSGCASLERDRQVPVDLPDAQEPSVPDADPPPPPPDAGETPDCEPPPPPPCEDECKWNTDCEEGQVCQGGQCYDRCFCDADCSEGQRCKWGVCKPPQHD